MSPSDGDLPKSRREEASAPCPFEPSLDRAQPEHVDDGLQPVAFGTPGLIHLGDVPQKLVAVRPVRVGPPRKLVPVQPAVGIPAVVAPGKLPVAVLDVLMVSGHCSRSLSWSLAKPLPTTASRASNGCRINQAQSPSSSSSSSSGSSSKRVLVGRLTVGFGRSSKSTADVAARSIRTATSHNRVASAADILSIFSGVSVLSRSTIFDSATAAILRWRSFLRRRDRTCSSRSIRLM